MKAPSLLAFLFAVVASAAQSAPVPDAQSAIAIAVAAWVPVYGKDHIEGEKPYRAFLKDGVWHVSGSLPKNAVGGVPSAEIRQGDGKVLRVAHSR